MPLRILNKGGWRIKAHGLVIQPRRRKYAQVAGFQESACQHDLGKACRVRLGESVQRERSDDWTTGECCDGRCLHFAEKCVFREFMKKRLIPADGFYELEVDWPL
jgi:hypothetical protein